MRAAAGAIDGIEIVDGSLRAHVIGGGRAAGICGSGLVDAVAAALDLKLVDAGGRVRTEDRRIRLADEVWLTQQDIRELQLAKGAVAAGLEILDGADAHELHLAGAFGNYIRAESARRIGLLPEGARLIHAAGNTALRGARMLLLAPSRRDMILSRLTAATKHVELHADPQFQDRYVDSMAFPS